MIIFGTGITYLNTVDSDSSKCPNCGAEKTFRFHIFGRYFHVFRIPFIPIGKGWDTDCRECKHAFLVHDLDKETRHELKKVSRSQFPPIWHFSGVVAILLATVFVLYNGRTVEEPRDEYAQSPQIGDIYHTKGETDGYYSSWKVANVTNDSIYVHLNVYETSGITGLSDIDVEDNYTEETYGLALSEIPSLLEENEIVAIERNDLN